MKQYDFTKQGIESFYNNVINESLDTSADLLNGNIEKTFDDIAIVITIGGSTITIPNTADNVEEICQTIKECFENTIELK